MNTKSSWKKEAFTPLKHLKILRYIITAPVKFVVYVEMTLSVRLFPPLQLNLYWWKFTQL